MVWELILVLEKTIQTKEVKKIGSRIKDDYFKINTNIDILYDRW